MISILKALRAMLFVCLTVAKVASVKLFQWQLTSKLRSGRVDIDKAKNLFLLFFSELLGFPC